jgi:uncharacterized protein YmfQ (DUF2313 family)
MTFKETLKQLTPLDLGAVDELLASIDAAALDNAQAWANQLLSEVKPDQAAILISDWERVYNVRPAATASLQERRDKILGLMSSAGGISRAYFLAIASLLGYTITITEYVPARCGVARCGDALYVEAARWMWTVSGLTLTGGFARCGSLACGDRLSHPSVSIEDIFAALKPASTLVNFVYS